MSELTDLARVQAGMLREHSMLPAAAATMEDVAAEADDQRKQKDGAYEERNRLVSLLAAIYPSGLCQTEIEGWSPEWHWCVYIETPAGQMSWHVHESQLGLFDHVERREVNWDGHTTEEKYQRVDALALFETTHS